MPAPAILHLPAGTVRPVPPEGVTCLEGLCWATQTGDPADHILRPGASWRPAPGRRALVWALTDAALRPAVGGAAPRLWGAVGLLLRALHPARA